MRRGYATPKLKAKGGFAPILILVIVAISILGVVVYQQIKPKVQQQPQSTSPLTPSPLTKPSEETKADETDSWKTYTNQEHGFEFRYPKDWIEQESRNALVEIKDNGNRLILTINSFDPTVVGVTYCGANPQDTKRCERSVVASRYVTIDWLGEFSGESEVILKEGLSMGLKTNPDVPARLFLTSDDKALFRKIHSTFKFLK